MNLEEIQAKIAACTKDMVAADRAGQSLTAADAIYKHFDLDEVNSWSDPQATMMIMTVRNEFNAAVAKLNAKRRP